MRNARGRFRTLSRSVSHRITVAGDLDIVVVDNGSGGDRFAERLVEVGDER
jgi:hypothetical protein